MKIYGDGSQQWRSVSLMFTEQHVIWGMDSPLEDCYLQALDRNTGEIAQGARFTGPVWYTKQLEDGLTLLQTTVEVGPGVQSRYVHIFASADLLTWHEVGKFKKDRWPMPWFKFGVIAFSDGSQSSGDFIVHGEGLVALDGCSFQACLVEKNETEY